MFLELESDGHNSPHTIIRIDQVMGSDRPDNEKNPPVSTAPLLQDDEFASTLMPNEAGECPGMFHNGNWAVTDPISFPYMPVMPPPGSPFAWTNLNRTHQSYPHGIPSTLDSLPDLSQLNSSLNPLTNPNYTSGRSNSPSLYWPVQGFPCSDENMKGVLTSHIRENCAAHFNSFQKPQVHRNFIPIKGNGAGYPQVIGQGGEVNMSNFHGLQINRNFVGLGDRTPVLYRNQTSGGTGIDDHGNASGTQIGSQKVDGSFLTLGVGGRTGTRSKFDLNNVEITNELDKAVSPPLSTSHVRSGSRNSLHLGRSLAGGSSTPLNNVGGYSSLADDTAGLSLSTNDVGFLCQAGADVSSSPFSFKPQVDTQADFCIPTSKNLGVVANRDSRYGNRDSYRGFLGDRATPSGPNSSSSAGFLDSGQLGLPGVAPQSAKHPQMTSDKLQKSHMRTAQNFLPGTSVVYPFVGTSGSFTKTDHSGQLFPASERSKTQSAESSTMFPRRIGVQRAGKLGRPQCTLPVQFPESHLQPPFATGQPNYGVAAQFSTGLRGPSFTPGEYHESVPVHLHKDFNVPDSTTGQQIPIAKGIGIPPASNVRSGPFLKRTVIRPPQADPRVQRRKITIQPPIYPSMPPHLQTVPAAPSVHIPVSAPGVHIPVAAPHIKWEGSGGSPKTTGQKCFLCKRDLSFTPEGPFCQPAVPPPVAVLPCGHTFHDHCLHKITPKDQAKDPPCIPCAIGEI